MRISGGYRELSFLMRLAIQMKGEYLYFGPEGDFWLVYSGGRSAYLKTKLDISHHIVMGSSSLKNILDALVRAKKNERIQEEVSDMIGEDYMSISTDHIQIGYDSTTKILMNTRIERVELFSPLVTRLESMTELTEPEGTPYLRLDDKLILRYQSDMKQYLRQFKPGWDHSLSKFKPDDDETANVLRIEPDGELGITRGGTRSVAAPDHTFRYNVGWFVPDRFKEFTFYLSDTDIRLMGLACKYESIFEFRVLLFKEHYVIDAHEADLRFKMWLNRKKSVVTKKML